MDTITDLMAFEHGLPNKTVASEQVRFFLVPRYAAELRRLSEFSYKQLNYIEFKVSDGFGVERTIRSEYKDENQRVFFALVVPQMFSAIIDSCTLLEGAIKDYPHRHRANAISQAEQYVTGFCQRLCSKMSALDEEMVSAAGEGVKHLDGSEELRVFLEVAKSNFDAIRNTHLRSRLSAFHHDYFSLIHTFLTIMALLVAAAAIIK